MIDIEAIETKINELFFNNNWTNYNKITCILHQEFPEIDKIVHTIFASPSFRNTPCLFMNKKYYNKFIKIDNFIFGSVLFSEGTVCYFYLFSTDFDFIYEMENDTLYFTKNYSLNEIESFILLSL